MKTLTTITDRQLKVSSNKKARTFTIVTNTKSKYRTYPMSKDEFQSCLQNTGNDWQTFLRSSSDYYPVK